MKFFFKLEILNLKTWSRFLAVRLCNKPRFSHFFEGDVLLHPSSSFEIPYSSHHRKSIRSPSMKFLIVLSVLRKEEKYSSKHNNSFSMNFCETRFSYRAHKNQSTRQDLTRKLFHYQENALPLYNLENTANPCEVYFLKKSYVKFLWALKSHGSSNLMLNSV